MQIGFDKIILEPALHVFDGMTNCVINHISAFEGVDEVKRLSDENEIFY